MTPSDIGHTEGVPAAPTPFAAPLIINPAIVERLSLTPNSNRGLNPSLNPLDFETWASGLDKATSDFLNQYRDVARRMFERASTIKTIADKNGLTVGQAAQMLPPKYWMRQIGEEFQCSESTVYNVKRVVDSIPVERLPIQPMEAVAV